VSAEVSRVGVVVHGRVVAIDVPAAVDRAAVRAILGGFPAPPAGARVEATYAVRRAPDHGWTVHSADTVTHRAMTLDGTLLALEWQLVTDLLARGLETFHLHGAALRDPSGGMAVLVLGESGAGKTTLTLALVAAGFMPYADDVVLIDVEGLTPATFPRAFHVDDTTRRLLEALPHDPSWEVPDLPAGYFLPAAWAPEPVPVGLIIFLKARGQDRPLLVALPIAEAATALLSFTGSLDRSPALALRAAARLTAAAPGFALYGGPLAATVELIADTIGRLPDERTGPSVPNQ
jgi:hypothetical protein